MTGIQGKEIVPKARLFQDLRVGGDDATDLLIAFSEAFGVDLTGVDVTKYFPDEAASNVLYQILFWKRARNAFAALTVGDLIAAVEAKSLATVLANRALAE